MNLKPLGDRLIVKALKSEDKTKGGIVLPDSAKEKSQQAKVIAVGSGKVIGDKIVPLEVKKGNKILFGRYSGDEVKVGVEEYLIIKESDVLAIIE
jgi:chaperonin GroES